MLDTALIWMCIYAYAIITVMLITGFIFNKDRLLSISGYCIVPAFLAHSLLFAMRWIRTGWFPANGELENAITAGWFAIAFTLYLFYRNRSLSGIALFTIPVTLLVIGFGVMKAPAPIPLSASMKSSWLIVHVLFAQISFGSYAIATGLGLIYLFKGRSLLSSRESAFYGRFPRLEVIDELMFKFVLYGFITEAIMLVAGSIWAKSLWGSYWGWDPVEVWSLLSWLLYGLSIHLRVTLGWRGVRQAWLMILLFATVLIMGWGVNFMIDNSKHVLGVIS